MATLDHLGVSEEEAAYAFHQFAVKGDDYASFGINKTCVFTRRRVEPLVMCA